jgi:hypothetical protein
MTVGFTGTQTGMTEKQIILLTEFFAKFGPKITEFHHGDCIGADRQAHDIACAMIGEEKVWVHPPDNDSKRAFCKSPHILRPLGYLARNREIVFAADQMLAAPKAGPAHPRSGTWYTIRQARTHHVPVLMLAAK